MPRYSLRPLKWLLKKCQIQKYLFSSIHPIKINLYLGASEEAEKALFKYNKFTSLICAWKNVYSGDSQCCFSKHDAAAVATATASCIKGALLLPLPLPQAGRLPYQHVAHSSIMQN